MLIVEKHDIIRWAGESKHWPAGGTLREMHYDEDEEVFKLVVDAPDDKTP